MSHKHLLFRSEAREKILKGAAAIADAIRVTLGPKSKCVLIEKRWGKPIVCNDGVTIAKEFELRDPDENLGAQMIRGAAERTGDAVGDGTTTCTILVRSWKACSSIAGTFLRISSRILRRCRRCSRTRASCCATRR